MSEVLFEYADKESVKLVGKGLDVNSTGINNKIYIGRNVVLSGLTVNIHSSNNFIYIGDGCRISGTIIMKIVDGNCIKFGDGVSVGGANFICGEGRTINIGGDCMIAWGIEFRTTDSHGIYDIDSKERINEGGDINIGEHVWVGAHSIILKNSEISDGCVIALRSVVSGKFLESNCVIAGVPAKVIKSGIYWERELLG